MMDTLSGSARIVEELSSVDMHSATVVIEATTVDELDELDTQHAVVLWAQRRGLSRAGISEQLEQTPIGADGQPLPIGRIRPTDIAGYRRTYRLSGGL